VDRRSLMRLLGGSLALGANWTSAVAQGGGANSTGYPTKPIRMVVPFPPGGAAEYLARPLSRYLADKLGQPIVVDNKPGANTVIGAENVVTSAPDGYTMLVANEAGLSLAPAFSPITKIKVPYQPATDFAPISLLGQYGSVLCINPAVPAQTLAEYIAYAKSNPGKMSYASFGVGSQPQMMMEVLNYQAKIETVHVPYKGVAPAMVDLVAGHVQAMISAPSAPISYIRDGRLRALAYSGTKRLPELLNVPTFAEAGMPDFEARGWFGVVVHAGTPAPIKAQLTEAIWSIVQSQDYQNNAILANGFEVPTTDPAGFRAFLAEDMRKWKVMVETVRSRLT
jgi:tripartite-type tricarboxylate transporter receptor subunit TctC